ncbi:MAG TPA: transglutaminase-like domain-containing protein [Bacillota bacterium]|nr:transglutaminase-like domain-containing protein [Bacillota bacterium]
MIRFNEEDIKHLAIELPYAVRYCKGIGDFRGVINEIDKLMATDIPHALRKRLIIEREVAKGLLKDYKTDFDTLLAKIQKKYPACSAQDLCEIVRRGHTDYIFQGELFRMVFQNSAAETILKCHERDLMRISDPGAEPQINPERAENHKIMKEKGYRAFRFEVRMSLSPSEAADRVGEKIKVHLPYPAPCRSQPGGEIKLLSSSHPVFISDAAQRTAYIENLHQKGEVYSVSFCYVNRAEYVIPDPSAVSEKQPDFYTGELYPHIRFTPLITELAREIAGDETNRLLLARRVYDWVTQNVKYSLMRDYLLIENIPEFAILEGRGDCGVMALTFITLCRRLGIPARWESGCCVHPDRIGSHDWAQFYVAPYGWLSCDPSYGAGELRSGNRELWDFYFCNIDPFRLVANTDFQQPFAPPKRFMRADPYDNQTGEAEYEDYGLGFGETIKKREVISAQEL